MYSSEVQTDRAQDRSVFEAFWHEQAATRGQNVQLLTETNLHAGGSLAAAIGNRFLIWEAWGELTRPMVASSLQAIYDAAIHAAAEGTRLAGFFDLTRVEIFGDDAQQALIAMRQKLAGRLAFDRTAVVFGSAMSRITYNMSALLLPSPWEEHVFPSVEEALIWLQDPINTLLIDVDGLSWIV